MLSDGGNYFKIANVNWLYKGLDGWTRMRLRAFKEKRKSYNSNRCITNAFLRDLGLKSLSILTSYKCYFFAALHRSNLQTAPPARTFIHIQQILATRSSTEPCTRSSASFFGSLVICVEHISLINQAKKEYPSRSRCMR